MTLAVKSIADLELGKVPYLFVGEWISAIVLWIITFLGFLGNLAIIVSIVKSHQSLNSSIRVILSLCIADLLLCLMQVVYTSRNLLSEGWNFGAAGCVVNAQIILSCEFVSINSLILLTADRYLIVIHHHYMSERKTSQILALIWVSSIVVCSYPVYTGNFWYILTLEPSKLFCSGVYWGKEPLLVLGIAIVLTVIALGVVVISIAYTKILFFYYSAIKRKRERLNSAIMMTVEDEAIKANERKLLFKCLAITGGFFLSWICYLVKIIMEVALSEPSDPIFDSISSIGVFLYSCLNPFVIYLFDASIRKVIDTQIAKMWSGLKERWKSSTSLSNLLTQPSSSGALPNPGSPAPDSPRANHLRLHDTGPVGTVKIKADATIKTPKN